MSTMKSEIGILYLSEFNRKSLEKLLRSAGLEFRHLIDCKAYVYLWKNHPLAGRSLYLLSAAGGNIRAWRLNRETTASFYLAEEILRHE